MIFGPNDKIIRLRLKLSNKTNNDPVSGNRVSACEVGHEAATVVFIAGHLEFSIRLTFSPLIFRAWRSVVLYTDSKSDGQQKLTLSVYARVQWCNVHTESRPLRTSPYLFSHNSALSGLGIGRVSASFGSHGQLTSPLYSHDETFLWDHGFAPDGRAPYSVGTAW